MKNLMTDKIKSAVIAYDIENKKPIKDNWEEEIKYLKVDISDRNTHFDILIDILKQLEKVWWASFEETKEEWTTLLMCARENPELFPIKK